MLLDLGISKVGISSLKDKIINKICDTFNIAIYPNLFEIMDVIQLDVINVCDGEVLYKFKIRLKANGKVTINNLEDYRQSIEELVERPIKFEIVDYKNIYVCVLNYENEKEINIVNNVKYNFVPCESFENVSSDNNKVMYEYVEGDKTGIKVCIGYDLDGNKVWFDMLNSHTLVGGASRWGKSSFLNVFITSVMLNYTPNEVMFLGCDYKKADVYYFRNYKHFRGMATNKSEFLSQLRGLEKEANKRAEILDSSNCRNVIKYNQISNEKLGYIIVVIDELPQLVDDEACKAKLHLAMQKYASYGIYFILSTQDCTKATIGKCKMNCSQTVGFHTRDLTDSTTLIGEGYNLQDIQVRGRCKFDNGTDGVIETQIFFLEEEEIEARLKHLKK